MAIETAAGDAVLAVRHPDHTTLNLKGWHEVLANAEAKASIEAQQKLAFTD